MTDIKETKHTIYLSSDIETYKCEFCDFQFNEYYGFSGKINHYLKKHNCCLLHVGQETGRDTDGKIWQKTIAIIGI